MEKFELVVIGSGPAGEKAAVKAAYFGHKVAVIEKENRLGGAKVNTGTLPCKTLKETAIYISGRYRKGLYGEDNTLRFDDLIEGFIRRKNTIIETEAEEVRKNFLRHNVAVYKGMASFEDSHHIRISGFKETSIHTDFTIIATGSYPNHPPHLPFDGKRIHDSDSILNITRFPQSMAILGAGVIGVEFATIFSAMGTKVFLINETDKILPFIDKEIVDHFIQHMQKDNIDLLFNKTLASIDSTNAEKLKVHLTSGETLEVDAFLFTAGRNGNTKNLKLERVGIQVDKKENIPVNEKYQTIVPNIYAAGDVIGFPALASTSMDQGRVAVAHIFQTKDLEEIAQVVPYGMYTIPEISMAGITEEQAKEKGLSYCVGVAKHENIPRGKLLGAKEGMLKILFTRDDFIIRGVHVIGYLSTEIIHHGVELIEGKKTLLDVIGKVYNYPTLHDLYKYAAYDGLGSLVGHKIKT